ncbi:MAG: cobalamin biosynthesis protein, partial [Prevotella sp.]|nr:cobalamin biosynthesis protein [Prevotella sp.]
MQKIAIIQISAEGAHVADVLLRELNAVSIPRAEVPAKWQQFDAFVFIGAMGICVRTIAPCLADKHVDPAVVCVDTFGRHVVSVLSGHVGGANDLAHVAASALGVAPVITTQSDNALLWPLDTLGDKYHWATRFSADSNALIALFVNRRPTALLLDIRDEGTDYLERTLPPYVTLVRSAADIDASVFALAVVVSPFDPVLPASLPFVHYVPQVLDLGIGLAHQAPLSVLDDIKSQLASHHIRLSQEAVRTLCTIDLKADEPVVRQLQADMPRTTLRLFTSSELAAVDVPTPSDTVARHVGTPSVSEASALLASRPGRLLLPKVKG